MLGKANFQFTRESETFFRENRKVVARTCLYFDASMKSLWLVLFNYDFFTLCAKTRVLLENLKRPLKAFLKSINLSLIWLRNKLLNVSTFKNMIF